MTVSGREKQSIVEKVLSFLQQPLLNQWNKLVSLYYRVKGIVFYRTQFAAFGKRSAIHRPMLIHNPQYIHIGDNVLIRPGVRLEAVIADPANPPELRIGNNVNIEQDVHIVVIGKVVIGDNVSITARTCILGGTHPFLDIFHPGKIGDRLAGADSYTEIGDGCFLGVGSVIQMNVRLGKSVIVGSGTVVKKDVPSHCVVEGNPGTIILRYDPEKERWVVQRQRLPPQNESPG